MIGPDLEVLFVHGTSFLDDGKCQPNQARYIVPFVMRWRDNRWILNAVGVEDAQTLQESPSRVVQ